jgi:hypothetical protein
MAAVLASTSRPLTGGWAQTGGGGRRPSWDIVSSRVVGVSRKGSGSTASWAWQHASPQWRPSSPRRADPFTGGWAHAGGGGRRPSWHAPASYIAGGHHLETREQQVSRRRLKGQRQYSQWSIAARAACGRGRAGYVWCSARGGQYANIRLGAGRWRRPEAELTRVAAGLRVVSKAELSQGWGWWKGIKLGSSMAVLGRFR